MKPEDQKWIDVILDTNDMTNDELVKLCADLEQTVSEMRARLQAAQNTLHGRMKGSRETREELRAKLIKHMESQEHGEGEDSPGVEVAPRAFAQALGQMLKSRGFHNQ